MPTDTADNGCIRFLVDGDLTFFYEREKSNLPMTVNLRYQFEYLCLHNSN